MALIVQDDAGSVANANGYCTVDFFESYCEDRNIDISDYVEAEINGAIVKATDHIDHKFEPKLSGERLTDDQTTALPRSNFKDIYNKDFSAQIPTDFKKATCEYALASLGSDTGDLIPNPVYDESGFNVKSFSESVSGAVAESKVYKDDYVFNIDRKYPKADLYIQKYIKSIGSAYFFMRG